MRAALTGAVLIALAGCGGGSTGNESDEQMLVVTIQTANGPRNLTVEVADTVEEQTEGLMYRSQLSPDSGLLVAPYPPDGGEPKSVDFWTKNVPIPIDFIFIRADGTIARIAENAVPLSEERIPSGEPVAAILEINGGRSAELGISPGDTVSWPGQKK
jgi:uncharacterized membrane protein (UPF0127 family)